MHRRSSGTQCFIESAWGCLVLLLLCPSEPVLAQTGVDRLKPPAASALKDGLQLDPKNEELINVLVYSEAAAGNLPAALQADDQYMAIRPNDPNPWDTRGDLDGARASLRQAVQALTAAGQKLGARGALRSLALVSFLTGEGYASDLAFARQQKISGYEDAVVELLQSVQGDAPGAEQSEQKYIAARPELGAKGVENHQNFDAMDVAFAHNDPQAVLAAAGRLPSTYDVNLLYVRGWAYFETKDYAHAEQDFHNTIPGERVMASFGVVRGHSPLRAALAHFYLGQIYDATGKRDQAVNEYREFLSHFENSTAKLPQIAVARAALKKALP